MGGSDASTLIVLGKWCYGIASIDMFTRGIAKTLLAEIPSSTYEEAIKYYEGAIKVEPKATRAYEGAGDSYSALGKREEAIAMYKKCIEQKPWNDKVKAIQEEVKGKLAKLEG